MDGLSGFQSGQNIELSDGRLAVIRYVGNTHFAAGDWVGVELSDTSGKNDGAVQGQRYFDCAAGRGMFVRPAAVTVLEPSPPQTTANRTNVRTNGVVPKSRPSSMVIGGSKRQSVVDLKATKRQSMNAPSPTPASRVSRLASPSKSPTKQLDSTGSSAAPSRTGTPSSMRPRKSMLPPSKTSKTSMGPPPPLSSVNKVPRPSITGRVGGAAKPQNQMASVSRSPARRGSIQSGLNHKPGFPSPERETDASNDTQSHKDHDSGVTSPRTGYLHDERINGLESSVSDASMADRRGKTLGLRGRSPPVVHQRPQLNEPASNRELEDLKAKMRVLEKKRAEDRGKLKAAEKVQAERDKFESVIQKMQTKYQPQQQELQDLKRHIKEEQDKISDLEGKLAEHDSLMEVATLDREMAEETAESMKLELDTLRQKHEEMELEINVLREENDELGKEISPEDKTSQGWLQLERSNERLREALVRLRDVTQERESDLKDQVTELEADAHELANLKEEQRLAGEDLQQSNAIVGELRQQLETALGAEDMIEELTEKNMALSEKVDELKMTIEDLESLRELNDELETNHVENEKQLQDEIDYNESLLAEEARKAAVQDGTVQDLEYTVSRFRELVANMQSDLEDMRASQQITETEANELNSRSRAMMDLNMRLQTSASKTQVKAIDLELGKLQAQESLEHLSIVQLFLPETFQSEQDSVQALLRFRRLGFKANLMHNIVREHFTAPTTPIADDDVPSICDFLDKLIWVHSTCARFINHIQTCDVESFKRLGAAAYDLDTVERALNVWIEALKRDELKYEQCASELQRYIALMEHLAEVHISDDLEHFPDQVLAHAAIMQSHLDNSAISLCLLKSRLENVVGAPDSEDTTDQSDHLEIFERLDACVSQSRSAKVVIGKATRQIEDLKSRSLTLDPSALLVVEHTQEVTGEYTSSIRTFTSSVLKSLNDEMQEGDTASARISSAVSSGSVSFSSLANKIQATTGQLQIFYNLTNSISQILEIAAPPPPPPWKTLSQKMRDKQTDLVAREQEFSRLKDEVSERKNTLAIKDKILEELSVKNEVLEKRVGEAGGRRERVRELEAAADTFKAQEKDYVAKLSRLRNELQALESERENWKQTVSALPSDVQQAAAGAEVTTAASTLLHIDTLQSQIATLQSTVRYLRTAYQHGFLSASQAYLSTPVTRPPPRRDAVEREAKDVAREMLHLVAQPAAQPVQLRRRAKEDRLRWRPAKETSRWQVQRQKEEWWEWREWRDDVAQKAGRERREEGRRGEVKRRKAAHSEMVIATKLGGEMEVVGLGDVETATL